MSKLNKYFINGGISNFSQEEEFELGNPKSKGNIPDPKSDNEKMIMNAAYRWRLKLLNDPGGAFRNMVALLVTPKEKREQFDRLIHAGGGIVVEAKLVLFLVNPLLIIYAFAIN